MAQNMIDWIKTLDPSSKADMVRLLNWIEKQPDSRRLLDIFLYGSEEEFQEAFRQILD